MIAAHTERAHTIHDQFVRFMEDTRLHPRLLEFRKRLLI